MILTFLQNMTYNYVTLIQRLRKYMYWKVKTKKNDLGVLCGSYSLYKKNHIQCISVSRLKRSKNGGWNIFCAKAAPLSLQLQGDREGIGEGGGVEGGMEKKKEAQEVETWLQQHIRTKQAGREGTGIEGGLLLCDSSTVLHHVKVQLTPLLHSLHGVHSQPAATPLHFWTAVTGCCHMGHRG